MNARTVELVALLSSTISLYIVHDTAYISRSQASVNATPLHLIANHCVQISGIIVDAFVSAADAWQVMTPC